MALSNRIQESGVRIQQCFLTEKADSGALASLLPGGDAPRTSVLILTGANGNVSGSAPEFSYSEFFFNLTPEFCFGENIKIKQESEYRIQNSENSIPLWVEFSGESILIFFAHQGRGFNQYSDARGLATATLSPTRTEFIPVF